jgi:hypothetical protein
MTFAVLSLIFEAAVSALLVAVIIYAVKLNQRLGGLRERESELQDLITRFNEASRRAEASAATLRSVGTEAERSLRVMVDRAQALRDDLSYLIQRGERVADKVTERTMSPSFGPEKADSGPSRTTTPDPIARTTDDGDKAASQRKASWRPPHLASGPDSEAHHQSENDDPRSDAERELLRALRSAKLGA